MLRERGVNTRTRRMRRAERLRAAHEGLVNYSQAVRRAFAASGRGALANLPWLWSTCYDADLPLYTPGSERCAWSAETALCRRRQALDRAAFHAGVRV